METIYVKSKKGIEELTGRRTLSLKQRQLLIMTDGRRPKSYLIMLFKSLDTEKELNNLEKLGYIANKETYIGTPKPMGENSDKEGPPQQERPKEIDIWDGLTSEQLYNIKHFLIVQLEQEAGVLNKELEKKMMMAMSKEALKQLIPQWHMAIRDAKSGKVQADKIVGKFNHLLANPDELNFAKTKWSEELH